MNISRRKFLTTSLGSMGLCLSFESLFMQALQAGNILPRQAGKDKILVLVQLSGGNDGLNTVVPYGLGAYYDARPSIGIPANEVLHLNNQLGLHPSLKGLEQLYKNGKLAVIQGVGYPNPNRSHFRSMEIWQTADPNKIIDSGWLGRYLDCCAQDSANNNILPAVNVDSLLPKSLQANKVMAPSIANVQAFQFFTDPRYMEDKRLQFATFKNILNSFDLNRPEIALLRKVGLEANQASDVIFEAVAKYRAGGNYSKDQFSQGLQFIAKMITGGIPSSIYTISLDGFDTHSGQLNKQGKLLKELGDGLLAFQQDLEAHSLDKDVLVVCFSEFGRRVGENGGRGTDHGTAGPMFIVGTSIKGGIYGELPSLTNLDNGDLKYKVDFRTVYNTILNKWLKTDSQRIMSGNFGLLEFV